MAFRKRAYFFLKRGELLRIALWSGSGPGLWLWSVWLWSGAWLGLAWLGSGPGLLLMALVRVWLVWLWSGVTFEATFYVYGSGPGLLSLTLVRLALVRGYF